MTEQVSNYNTDAHYSTEIKIKRNGFIVANAPEQLPSVHVFSDKDATARLNSINNDIYQGAKVNIKPKKQNSINKLLKMEKRKNGFDARLFFKIFLCIGAAVAAFSCRNKILTLFNKFKY